MLGGSPGRTRADFSNRTAVPLRLPFSSVPPPPPPPPPGGGADRPAPPPTARLSPPGRRHPALPLQPRPSPAGRGRVLRQLVRGACPRRACSRSASAG